MVISSRNPAPDACEPAYTMKRTTTCLLVGLVLGGTLLVTLPALNAQDNPPVTPPATQPAPPSVSPARLLNAALRDLEQARIKLNRVPVDLEGHKAAALKACDEALKEVNAGMKIAEEKK
jgi:hypothetical protein